ncbi:hypothetical protein BGZ52_002957, partial [Haplosporangium bisporale]
MSRPPQQSKYSVLVMGKTQAGKSTLVQHIKNYANPNYPIDESLIGNGNLSTTKSPQLFYVESNLPVYEAVRRDGGDVIDLDDLINKVEDEEVYRKLVMSREKDVEMRVAAHHDPNGPSEVVEFRFLDTPGLNDTSEGDTGHAADIIKEMISIRSFNLIVIIVSYINPLTQEQQLALEYYANVFKGLHTRIMFLHTHVDYNEIHHTNQTHHLNLKMKNKALSKMFRPYDSDTVFDENNIQDYTSRTIDMVTKRRPVIKCLIRNTIREILNLATAPAAILDTSSLNIERIRAITHPTKFNDDERKRVKQRFLAEAAKLPKQEEEEQVDVGGSDLEQINILLIGDVQSGKSSLVETFRLYADPTYTVNTQHIMQGNSRFADEKVKITAFLSDLHTIQIRKKKDTGGYEVINLEEEAKRMSEEDFEDLLNLGQKEAEIFNITPNDAKRYRFNVYEGPSLNESAENFEKNIFSVHSTLVESKAEFHQVLFTLAPGPITSAIRTTIRVCSDIFSDLSPLFSFVHTKVDYPKLHAGNKQFQESMKERQELLQRYIQSGSDTYLIDNNLQSYSPVQRAKTQNVLHDILKAATNHKPIALKSPLMKKTPKMVSIDTTLKWQARDEFQKTQKEITKDNGELLEIRNKIRKLDSDYKAKDQEVNAAQIQKDASSRDDLEVIYQDAHEFGKVNFAEISSQPMTLTKQARQIEEVSIVNNNVDIEHSLGGKGCNHWKILYRRKNFDAASLVVTLYAKKQGSNGTLVGETPEMTDIRLQRAELEKQLTVVEERIRSKWHLQKEYNLLRDWISRETLPKAVMQELTKEEVYETKDTPFDKIKAIYLKSGGVYDTDPCESVEASKVHAPLTETEDCEDYFKDSRCQICDEKKCNCADKVEDDVEEVCRKDMNVRRGTTGLLTMARVGPFNYNILFLGETQSGKTALIESLKKYAHPSHTINKEAIGDGAYPKTQKVQAHTIYTNLPSYFVSWDGDTVDYGKFLDKSQEDYKSELDDPKYTSEREPSKAAKAVFKLIDTPGLSNTSLSDDLSDESTTAAILKALEEAVSIDLIVITITNTSFTDDLKAMLRAQIRLLSAFNGIFVFVHTGIDYSKLHPKEELFARTLTEKKRLLHDFMERDSVPHLQIDNDIEPTSPLRNCITQNTLRSILAMAKFNQPILTQSTRLKKTEMMLVVESILREKFSVLIATKEAALGHKDRDQHHLMAMVNSTKMLILEREQGLKDIVRKLAVHDSDALELVHEETYQQGNSYLSLAEPSRTMRYPLSGTPAYVSHVIDHIDIQAENIRVLEQTGGVGQSFWAVRFRRSRFRAGLYQVKIYITRRKKFAEEIEYLKTQKTVIKGQLEEHRSDLEEFEKITNMGLSVIRELLEDLELNRYLLARVSELELNFNVFQGLLDAGVFVREDSVSAIRLEHFYVERRHELEDLENDRNVSVLPLAYPDISEETERPDDCQYSVLLLGRTQAGKSTFVQFVKNYANPRYLINWDKIGHYVGSKTGKIEQFVVRTDLPEHEVYDDDTGAPIDIHTLSQNFRDADDYKDRVGVRATFLRQVPRDPEAAPEKDMVIRFLDTPGINDTNFRDIEHAKTIIDEMVRIQSFNLIVVVVNSLSPIHREQKVAFDYYARVIQELQGNHSNVVFLYTHVKYEECHQNNVKHQTNLQQKHKAFSRLFRGLGEMAPDGGINLEAGMEQDVELYPYYTIEHSIKDRPIIQCMIRKTLRKILQEAVSAQPVAMDVSPENLER